MLRLVEEWKMIEHILQSDVYAYVNEFGIVKSNKKSKRV